MNREKALYNYLIQNYDEERYISKYEICKDLSEYYNYNPEDTRICREIESDVSRINFSAEFDKIIVSSKKGYKIGNKEQIKNYIERLYNRDLKSLARTSIIRKKNSLDGQVVADDEFSSLLDEIRVYINA
jgi:ribosomal protein L23